MVFLLGLKDAGVRAGVRRILASVTLGLDEGERVGIVGPNGAGKSTLLRMLAGGELEHGQRTLTGGTRVAMLTQADPFAPGVSVRRAIHADAPEHVWASDPRQRQIHGGLLAGIDLDADIATLSGGQRRRVHLAAVLAERADVLLLDEPTNHLDIEGVAWLADHLRHHGPRALAVVTHDRWFLDEVCTRMWEVVPAVDPGDERAQIPGRIEEYEGSYAAYVLARAERARQAQIAARKRENLLRKELAWLRRGAPARTSKPRFRLDAAEALIADVPPPRDRVELVTLATARLGKRVVDLEDLTFAYPGAEPVLSAQTWRLAPGERVGIVGVNGAGKSTLLGLIDGRLEPTSGRVRRGKTVEIAHLTQSTRELDRVAHRRVVEAVADVKQTIRVGRGEMTASQMVERLGFTRERAWTPVGELSGGERRRLQLMRLLMSEPNVLLLDEPTNDLDTDTLAALEDLLDSFPGTLVVVSHDRYFLQRVTDHQVALLGDRRLRDLPGGIDEYLALVDRRVEAASRPRGPRPRGMSGAERYAAGKELAALERKMAKIEASIARIEQAMAEAATAGDFAEAARLNDEAEQARAERDGAEEAWLERAAALEE